MINEKLDLVDFHAHVLPGADHGSSSCEISTEQIRLASSCYVKRIIATPHFYPHIHTLNSFIERRTYAFEKIQSVAVKYDVKLLPAAEVLLCEGLHKFENLAQLCIGNSKSILLELPFTEFKDYMYHSVKKIKEAGYNVILAHADRYNPNIIEKFLPLGVKLQLNAKSLSTILIKRSLHSWINDKFVVGIGSDIHGKDVGAYKKFLKSKHKLGDNISVIKKESDLIWERAL